MNWAPMKCKVGATGNDTDVLAYRIPMENRMTLGKISNLGSGGVCRAIYSLHFKNRVAQNLRRIVLLHGIVSFFYSFQILVKSQCL